MPTQTTRPLRAEIILLIIAAVCAAMLITVLILSFPYIREDLMSRPPVSDGMDEDPEDAIRDQFPEDLPTDPTEPQEPQGPTLPPPEPNPYNRLDFQYNGKFLKTIYTDCRVGIDVSSHQGTIDWTQVAETDIEIVMVRAGYRGYGQAGKLVEDTNARQNILGAAAAGLDVGAYFFSQAVNVEEAEEEANMLLEILEGMPISMPVVYDWEYISAEARTAHVNARTLTDCALAFCAIIEEAGYTPMVYFNKYQSQHLMHISELKQYDFWLAWYSDRMNFPYKVRMWQYTDTGRVPGIETNVDLNVYFTH